MRIIWWLGIKKIIFFSFCSNRNSILLNSDEIKDPDCYNFILVDQIFLFESDAKEKARTSIFFIYLTVVSTPIFGFDTFPRNCLNTLEGIISNVCSCLKWAHIVCDFLILDELLNEICSSNRFSSSTQYFAFFSLMVFVCFHFPMMKYRLKFHNKRWY